jgi:type IV secretory pathway VirB10-like protein
MTDSTNPMNELPPLLEERSRYESWLTALEARRETTPQHVFERVNADYRGRLQRVEEQIASHRQHILDERASLESRLSLLKAEEQLRRDERAELELRAHVGELAGNEAEKAFRAVDEVINQLVSEKSVLEKRIGELDALLEIRPTPPAPAAAAPKAPPAPESVVAKAPVREPQREAAREPQREAQRQPAREAPREQTRGATREPQRESQELRVPQAPGDSFDELAFLSEVVGQKDRPSGAASAASSAASQPANSGQAAHTANASTFGRNDSGAESLLSGLDDSSRRTSGEAPFAANVSGNIPIVLRTSGQTEQTKTLKCGECGTMNYPTEWYCERCGAELAAL